MLRIAVAILLSSVQMTAQNVPGVRTQANFWAFSFSDVLMLICVLLAPLLAVNAQWHLQLRHQDYERKLAVFRSLMATRATRLAPAHVEALNAIEVEFRGRGRKERHVVEAWKLYLDHLGTRRDPNDAGLAKVWDERMGDLLTGLLSEMAACLDLDFDRVGIKRDVYYPIGHGEMELEHFVLRKRLLSLLTGESAIKMEVTSFPSDDEFVAKQKEALDKALAHYAGEFSVPVTLTDKKPPLTPAGQEPAA